MMAHYYCFFHSTSIRQNKGAHLPFSTKLQSLQSNSVSLDVTAALLSLVFAVFTVICIIMLILFSSITIYSRKQCIGDA